MRSNEDLNNVANICYRGISPDEKRGGRGSWNWGCADDPARSVDLTVETATCTFGQIGVTAFVIVHKPFLLKRVNGGDV